MPPKLVLSMIAGNEDRVIRRCLESVKPHVDAMVVSVNGRDGTEDICRELGAHVVREPWRDFGYNRTRAAQASRRHAFGLGFDGRETYLLLVDADMVLKVDDPDFSKRLSAPHYRIDQRSGPTWRAENSRLLRLDHDWRCVRRTHEYWAPFPDVYPAKLEGIWLDDINDGGEHGRKYERDIELLSLDLEETPGDARSLFYLGETHFHWAQQAEEKGQAQRKNAFLSDYERALEVKRWNATAVDRYQAAIRYYEARWEAGDWDEERWYARYKWGLGALALERLLENVTGGRELLLEAIEARPGRAEPLAALAKHYRERGKNHLAVMFAKIARATPPSRDALFVDESAWTTKTDEELAISSYYVGDLEGGMAACMRLSRARERGPGFQDHVATVTSFYVPQAAQATRRGKFEIPAEVLEGGRWAPSTPTIVPTIDGFLVGVRLVNYWQERGRVYASRDPDGHIRTKTAVVRMSMNLEEQEFLGVQEYVPPAGWKQGWEPGVSIIGLEDQRWCLYDNQIWFTATTYDGDPPRGPRVVLGRLSDDGLKVEFVKDIPYSGATACEKNWVPRGGGELELVYSYDPFTLLRVDLPALHVTKTEPPMMANRWRGGAFDGNTGIVHEVVRHENHNVYAAGLAWYSNQLIVTYSHEDREARFIVFSMDEFRSLFP